jgi:hypothetical protein
MYAYIPAMFVTLETSIVIDLHSERHAPSRAFGSSGLVLLVGGGSGFAKFVQLI